MFKEIAVLCLMSLIGLLSGMVIICFAEDANNLEQAEQNVISLIKTGDFNSAGSATNQLIANFSGGPGLDKAVHHIAGEYQDVGKYQKATELSRYVVTNWPKSEHAVWAQMAIVRCNLELGNETAAQAETKTLIANYGDDPNLPWTLNIVGINYMGWGKYEAARGIFEEVIEKYPQSSHASDSRIYIRGTEVLSLIDSSDYADADTALDKLFDDFAGHTNLPLMAKMIGERYYRDGLAKENNGLTDRARDGFEGAVNIWDRVINGLPNSQTPEICCLAGDCYYKLGKYEESMRRFQRVVDDYPDYRYAWRALFMVGHNYKNMKNSGLIPESEAQTKIRAVYEQLLQRYPNSIVAAPARTWLNEHNSK